MTVMAKSRGVISWRTWLINALLVACGNLAGIACFSLLIWFSGLVMSENAMWGVAVLHCAEGKMHHTFTESVSLGIMCNLMVCPGAVDELLRAFIMRQNRRYDFAHHPVCRQWL